MRHAVLGFAVACLLATTPALAQEALLKCPIAQASVRNGDKPDPELLKKLVRCRHGEKAVAPGDEGAVTVEVASLAVGAPRTWDRSRDLGNGDLGTKVYPTKVSFTKKTHWRTRTEVSEDWIRVVNFYVNAFGEWQAGSEEGIKSGTYKSVPRQM